MVLFGALALIPLAGCAAVAAPAEATNDRQRRYHDGERWVELTVALDRLHLERSGVEPESRPVEVYLLRTPVASVAALDDVARQMLAAQHDIHRISAYVLVTSEPASQPVRLTHQLVLRGSAGQDLDALAATAGARVIERVEHSPDTAICLATGSSLLAALDAADALRQQPGVALAMPLIKRAHALRSR